MNTCTANSHSGLPCRFRVRPGVAVCFNHDPAQRLARRSAAVNAGRASGAARRAPAALLAETVLALTDRVSIQAVIDAVVRLELAGRIPPARSRNILRALSIAVRNFDRSDLLGDSASSHRHHAYFDKVRALLDTIDPLIEEAHANGNPPSPPPA